MPDIRWTDSPQEPDQNTDDPRRIATLDDGRPDAWTQPAARE
ncbi:MULTISPECIES: hypothetical protein [unclassified Frankia]|nr:MULTISPECIES: hypothetical protein [unclassified Frankia]